MIEYSKIININSRYNIIANQSLILAIIIVESEININYSYYQIYSRRVKIAIANCDRSSIKSSSFLRSLLRIYLI